MSAPRVAALLPRLKPKTDRRFLEPRWRITSRRAPTSTSWPKAGRAAGRSIRNICPRLVSELAADDAVFTCDVGTPTVWAARYLKMNGKRRLIGSFNHGSMANAHAAGDRRAGRAIPAGR